MSMMIIISGAAHRGGLGPDAQASQPRRHASNAATTRFGVLRIALALCRWLWTVHADLGVCLAARPQRRHSTWRIESGQAEAASTPCAISRPRSTKRRPPDRGLCTLRWRRFSVQLSGCGARRRQSRPGVISPSGKSIRLSLRAHLRMSRSGNFPSKSGRVAPKCTDREILIDFARLGRQISRSVNSCIHL